MTPKQFAWMAGAGAVGLVVGAATLYFMKEWDVPFLKELT